jgi:hypothetical protein
MGGDRRGVNAKLQITQITQILKGRGWTGDAERVS